MSVPPVRTQVRFVAGFEKGRTIPWQAQQPWLQQRFAVIQETYRPDCGDMYFDEALWLALIDFAGAFLGGSMPVTIVDEEGAETPREEFLAAWRRLAPDDRAPEGVLLRDERGATVLYIAPVLWARVGGPAPYHDSYTYEIYSYDDVSERVLRFLAENDTAWDLSPRVLKPGQSGA